MRVLQNYKEDIKMTFDYNVTFTAKTPHGVNKISKELLDNLTPKKRFLAKVIDMKEGDSGLSHSRFAQATATNWLPKAVFARSLADLSEISFLEVFESALFFYLPSLMGEYLSRRKIFSKFLPKDLRKDVSKSVAELANNPAAGKLLPVKAGIVLSCAAIPAAEYGLSFAKNLFTQKLFNKADFSNVVNLDKEKKEDPKVYERVEKSAVSHLKKVGIVSAAAFGASIALAAAGRKSRAVQKASEIFLNPGAKIYNLLEKTGVKSKGLKNFLDTYVNLDFARKSDGSLALGNGQLAVTVLSGVAGYFGAAKDRGKLEVQEVATRVPVIALYTIFGSTLFDAGFKKLLQKNGKYPEILSKDLNVASLNDIPKIAKQIAGDDKNLYKQKIGELFKGKAVIAMVPFLFSLLVVGGLLALISRLWTQYRYNRSIADKPPVQPAFNNSFGTGSNILINQIHKAG